jgi:hypothetical protein
MIAMRSHHDSARRPAVTDGIRQQVGEHLTQLRLFEAHAAAALIDHLQRHASRRRDAEEHAAHVREGRRHVPVAGIERAVSSRAVRNRSSTMSTSCCVAGSAVRRSRRPGVRLEQIGIARHRRQMPAQAVRRIAEEVVADP